MKNFNIMAVHGKIRFLGGGGEGFREEPIYREELPKKGEGGAWTVYRFKGGLGEKEGMVFLRGGQVISQCTPVIPEDHVIKGPCGFFGGSPSCGSENITLFWLNSKIQHVQ